MAGFGALIDLTADSESKLVVTKTPNQKQTTKPRDTPQKNTHRLASSSPATNNSQRPLDSSNRLSIELNGNAAFSKQHLRLFHRPQPHASAGLRTSPVQDVFGEDVRGIDRPVWPGLGRSTTKSFVDLTRDDGGNRAPSQSRKHQFSMHKSLHNETRPSILTNSEEEPPVRFLPLVPSSGAERTSNQLSDRGQPTSTSTTSPSFKVPKAGIPITSPAQDLEAFAIPGMETTADWAVLTSSAQKSATEAAVSNQRYWDALASTMGRTSEPANPDSPRPNSAILDLSGSASTSKVAEPTSEEHSKLHTLSMFSQGPLSTFKSSSASESESESGSESESESEGEAKQIISTGNGINRTIAATLALSSARLDEGENTRRSLMDADILEAVEPEKHDMKNESIPLLLPSFQEILQKHVRELHEDQEYFTKLRLLRARRKCESRTSKTQTSRTTKFDPAIGGPSIYSSKDVRDLSPFATLKPLDVTVSTPTERSSRSPGKLHQHLIRGSKHESLKLAVPRTSYKSITIKLPPYTNYISSRGNILTEDEVQTTYHPYHGDDHPMDDDYYEFEIRVGESIRRFQSRNHYAEKAEHYTSYACRFLEEVGCGYQDVLRYLLDETNPVVPVEMTSASADCWLNRESHLDEDYYLPTDAEEGESETTTPRRGRPKSTPQARNLGQGKKIRPYRWQAVFDQLPPSDPRTSAVAGLACAAFRKVTGFSIWHIVKTLDLERVNGDMTVHDTSSTSGRGRGREREEHNVLGTYTGLGCLVCFAHECPGHGEFIKENGVDNTRIRANTKPLSPKIVKSNGVDIPQSIDTTQLIGMNDDGSVSGLPIDEMTDLDTVFADNELCSDSCFWKKANRSGLKVTPWLDEDRVLLQALLPAYAHNKRAACMIALAIQKPCVEIFLQIQEPSTKPTHISVKARNVATVPHRSGPKRNGDYWHEHSITWKHDDRPPFRPCNHKGACSVANECSCCIVGVTCEKTCMCANNCSRRFQGCSCATRAKVCWGNDKCDCFYLGRECDPDLCGTCGARQVLDPVNRYKDDLVKGKCMNVYVQRGVPKHTLLGDSKLLASGGVSGWGLYMGEPVRAGDYLGEYVGEVVSHEEAERRGAIYNRRNLSYLFDLNTRQTLDSTRIGNKFRYINHQAPPYANCKAKVLLCNTVHRIGMFALRNIEIGEELLFDYGPGFASQFVAVQLHPNAPPTLERPKKGVAQKVLNIRPATAKKTGARIGRPRKYSANGTPVNKLKSKHKPTGKGLEHLSAGSLGLEDVFDIPNNGPGVLGGDTEAPGSEDDEVVLSEEAEFEAGTSSEDESYHESDEVEIEDPIPAAASSKKKEKEKAEPEEYENPQKRGWKTRYANMAKRKRGF